MKKISTLMVKNHHHGSPQYQVKLIKKLSLIALLATAPLVVVAQSAVFTDNFGNGSTTNKISTPGGTPTASSTSYDIASSKAATGGASGPIINNGRLRISLNSGTTGGSVEAQAIFTTTPISLVNLGDYINLTYVFTNTGGTLISAGTNSAIFVGLFNSGVSVPATNLANSGLNATAGSPLATGNCANWQGYVARITPSLPSQPQVNCVIYTRPLQNGAGTTSQNQELLGNNFGSGTYVNPTGVQIGDPILPTITLTAGAVYTNSFTIALTAVGALTITNNLYDSSGNLIFTETNTASGTTNLTQTFDGLSIGSRNSGTSQNPTMDITSISVIKNLNGLPGTTFDVTGSSNGCPGSPYLVHLSGSVLTNDYRLYTNGVYDGAVAVQTGNGSPLTFGPVSIVGTNTILASNNVAGGGGFTGYMAGSAVFAIDGAPVITAQPASVLVASGYSAVFNVSATGGNLSYQWYQNGAPLSDAGSISGSQTASLTNNPATASVPLATGYYVVISNPCGLVTNSITNSLTLDSPANLEWVGNNPNTNWDLAATANWTTSFGSQTATTRFNSGDNVTFDDSSLNQIVYLVGSLDPTSITESSSLGYTFYGNGTFFGPGALVMNGSGTLTISNANSYTGGTTINSGDVNIKNSAGQALGTGPVTLAGGELEIGVASGSATTGLSNVNVTASSTLQLDTSGTYSFVVMNSLTGTPGAPLTIRNNLNTSTATSRMRVYGVFTNTGPIILSSAGNPFEFTPYNPNGDQVYNGLISGTGGRVTVRAAGNVILANANTFNDSSIAANGFGPAYGGGPSAGLYGYSVLVSGGNVGVGTDSSFDFGAYVPGGSSASGSSPLGTGILGINSGPSEGGNASLFAYGGAHTVANPVLYTTANTNYVLFFIGNNNLTLSGTFNLNGADNTGGTNRILNVTNGMLATLSGVVGDAGLTCGIIKTGTGMLALNSSDTYTGPTIVSNGMLEGIGTLASPVTVESGATLGAGTTAIGTFTINNNLTLAGNGLFKLNKSLAQSNDLVSVSGVLTNSGTGTITVTNLGTALVIGDKFTLFSEAVSNGAALTITGGGMNWTNNLAVDGSIQALSMASATANYPTNITFSLTGSTLAIGWPATHLGWILQSQTNPLSVGLTIPSNTWFDVAGTASGTNATATINSTNPTVFFRLRHP